MPSREVPSRKASAQRGTRLRDGPGPTTRGVSVLGLQAVFDLPRVVECVPGCPADEVTRGPEPTGARNALRRFASGRGRERGLGRGPQVGGGSVPELADIRALGVGNVLEDLLEVPPAPARALREIAPAGGVRRSVERRPTRAKDRELPVGPATVQPAIIRLRCDRRCAESVVALPFTSSRTRSAAARGGGSKPSRRRATTFA